MRVKENSGEDIDWAVLQYRRLMEQIGPRPIPTLTMTQVRRAKRMMRSAWIPDAHQVAKALGTSVETIDLTLWRTLGNQAEWDQRWA